MKVRFCTDCGKEEGLVKFSSLTSIRCTGCLKLLVNEAKERKAAYRNARLRALTRLSRMHRDEYLGYLAIERAREDERLKEGQDQVA